LAKGNPREVKRVTQGTPLSYLNDHEKQVKKASEIREGIV